MIDWIIILALIIAGIGLIVAEVIFVPGTTVVGFVGFGIMAYAIYMAYSDLGSAEGTIILIASIFMTGIAFYFSFKSGAWRKFSLKTSSEGKVNEEYPIDLQIEQRGKTLSALRPFGKAEFNDQEYEVRTFGDYVAAGTPVKIISVQGKKIVVEPLKDK